MCSWYRPNTYNSSRYNIVSKLYFNFVFCAVITAVWVWSLFWLWCVVPMATTLDCRAWPVWVWSLFWTAELVPTVTTLDCRACPVWAWSLFWLRCVVPMVTTLDCGAWPVWAWSLFWLWCVVPTVTTLDWWAGPDVGDYLQIGKLWWPSPAHCRCQTWPITPDHWPGQLELTMSFRGSGESRKFSSSEHCSVETHQYNGSW